MVGQYPQVLHTQPLYQAFRRAVVRDMMGSARLGHTGLTQLLCDIVQYAFAGAPTPTPAPLFGTLSELVHPHHALVLETVPGQRPKLLLHQWPSWLQRGSTRTVQLFFELFYPPGQGDDTFGPGQAPARAAGHCALC